MPQGSGNVFDRSTAPRQGMFGRRRSKPVPVMVGPGDMRQPGQIGSLPVKPPMFGGGIRGGLGVKPILPGAGLIGPRSFQPVRPGLGGAMTGTSKFQPPPRRPGRDPSGRGLSTERDLETLGRGYADPSIGNIAGGVRNALGVMNPIGTAISTAIGEAIGIPGLGLQRSFEGFIGNNPRLREMVEAGMSPNEAFKAYVNERQSMMVNVEARRARGSTGAAGGGRRAGGGAGSFGGGQKTSSGALGGAGGV